MALLYHFPILLCRYISLNTQPTSPGIPQELRYVANSDWTEDFLYVHTHYLVRALCYTPTQEKNLLKLSESIREWGALVWESREEFPRASTNWPSLCVSEWVTFSFRGSFLFCEVSGILCSLNRHLPYACSLLKWFSLTKVTAKIMAWKTHQTNKL